MDKRKAVFSYRVLIWGALLLFWMTVIFLFSSVPGSPYAYVEPTLWYFLERKGAHVAEYALLMFLAMRFLSTLFTKERFSNILILALLLSLLYGATDELHQSFIPNRGAKVTDILIDGLGIGIAALFSSLARPRLKQNKKK